MYFEIRFIFISTKNNNVILSIVDIRASAGAPKNKVDWTVKEGWLFEAFEERKKSSSSHLSPKP